ncbi:hypothetical protein CEP52_015863 [Fusarium oligoseptatum]|uniref:Uncharacterized protein n=1 Tax=Fusarium oligoseptatum TaxID=2604345 RepID=A0A428S9C5_9HYPO|nr:hypothetical protein CEP52_015863 [Fusarium oligoseptatum]
MVPMMWNKALLFSLQAVLLTATAAKVPLPIKSSLPSIDVTLTPYLNVKNATIHGRVVWDGHVAKNETLVVLPLTMAGQPSSQYTKKSLRASDSRGAFLDLPGVFGGTALTRSFTFGWFHESSTTDERLEFLLAHEMTHNWPAITVGNDSAISRYAEGAAEYYSLRLLWRNGQISTEVYLQAMNTRIESYYLNPYANLSDKEAYDQSWVIPQAQTIPYDVVSSTSPMWTEKCEPRPTAQRAWIPSL